MIVNVMKAAYLYFFQVIHFTVHMNGSISNGIATPRIWVHVPCHAWVKKILCRINPFRGKATYMTHWLRGGDRHYVVRMHDIICRYTH